MPAVGNPDTTFMQVSHGRSLTLLRFRVGPSTGGGLPMPHIHTLSSTQYPRETLISFPLHQWAWYHLNSSNKSWKKHRLQEYRTVWVIALSPNTFTEQFIRVIPDVVFSGLQAPWNHYRSFRVQSCFEAMSWGSIRICSLEYFHNYRYDRTSFLLERSAQAIRDDRFWSIPSCFRRFSMLVSFRSYGLQATCNLDHKYWFSNDMCVLAAPFLKQ